ncbi:MAG: 4Fe-4S dicluster domain-containing protein, partial [Gammaproteobacteria bacterium]
LDALCTGCGLCVPPCPVDCIDLYAASEFVESWPHARSAAAGPILDSDAEPCIECGACVPVCPVQLSPVALLRSIQTADFDSARSLGVGACTGCSACQQVCPSRIPLTAYFNHAKQVVQAVDSSDEAATDAQRRYGTHTARFDGSKHSDQFPSLADLDHVTTVVAQDEILRAIARVQSQRDAAE